MALFEVHAKNTFLHCQDMTPARGARRSVSEPASLEYELEPPAYRVMEEKVAGSDSPFSVSTVCSYTTSETFVVVQGGDETPQRSGVILNDVNIERSQLQSMIEVMMENAPTTDQTTVRGRGPKCFNCGEFGHMLDECTHSEPRCYECDQFGHRSKDCPNPRSAEEKRVQKAAKKRCAQEAKDVELKRSELRGRLQIVVQKIVEEKRAQKAAKKSGAKATPHARFTDDKLPMIIQTL